MLFSLQITFSSLLTATSLLEVILGYPIKFCTNTVLHNQIANMSNALEMLLARIPQTMASPNQTGADLPAGAYTYGAHHQASGSEQCQPGANE